ncbi:MAG: hypothetical protein KKB20_18060, partial [Proteobacteria bacterium]|nr:hypothetical protein [Pseudomonadota bacterium]
ALAEAASLIEVSLGRQRSTGFFQSPHPASGLAPSQAATSGLFIGRVLAGSDDGALIRLQHPLETGDRLRVQFKKDDEREAYNLRRMAVAGQPVEAAEAEREVFLYAPFATNEGDLVFKVDSGRGEEEAMASPLVRAFKERAETQIKPSPALKSARADLVRKPGSRAGTAAKPEVWYRLPRAEMLTGLAPLRPDAVILPLTRSNVRRAAAMRRRLGALYDHLVWSLPPLIFESDKTGLRADLAQLGKMKVFRYMISNLGHLPLLPSTGSGRGGRGVTVYADHRLNCLNSQTEAALAGLGIDGVTLSVETDEDNMKRLLESTGPVARLIYLYGRPPLFTSRFVTAGLKDNLPVESPRGEKFRWRQEGRTAVLFSERPVFMAPLLKYKPLNGVKAWIVDLEYDPRPVATAFEVNEAIAKGRPIRHASRFNFGRSLY